MGLLFEFELTFFDGNDCLSLSVARIYSEVDLGDLVYNLCFNIPIGNPLIKVNQCQTATIQHSEDQ